MSLIDREQNHREDMRAHWDTYCQFIYKIKLVNAISLTELSLITDRMTLLVTATTYYNVAIFFSF